MNRGRALGPGRLWRHHDRWLLDWRDECGRRRRRTLGSDRRTAERIRADLIRRRDLSLAGLSAEAGQELPLAELARDYLDDLEPRVGEMHFKNVSQRLHRLLSQLAALRVGDLKPMHVTRLRGDAVAQGVSNRTANLTVQTVQAMLRWGVDNELVARNPIAGVKPLPYTRAHFRHRRRAMNEEEIHRFLEAARADDEENELLWDYPRVPQTVLWRTALETGARYGELRQLRWGDLDLRRRLLVLRAETTKSRKQRSIPLRPDLVDALRTLQVRHETIIGRLPASSDLIFLTPEGKAWARPSTNLMRVFDRVLRRAGIAKIGVDGRKLDIHALRTTAASRMARHGVPLVIAQRILGHASARTTSELYTVLDCEDLRGAVESLPTLDVTPHAEHQHKEAR